MIIHYKFQTLIPLSLYVGAGGAGIPIAWSSMELAMCWPNLKPPMVVPASWRLREN